MSGTTMTTTQSFAKPPFTAADLTARGEADKGLGAISYQVIDQGSTLTLEVTWPTNFAAAPAAAAPAVAAVAAAPMAMPAPGPAPAPNPAFAFGQKIVEHWEQCSLTVYHGAADKPNVWTIGWGCISMQGQPVTAATPPITQAVADKLLADELNVTQTGINGCVIVGLTTYQEAALISFVYNIGLANFQSSTMLTLLNGGHVTEAAEQFSRWVIANSVKVNGLVRRRGAEAAVFLGKIPFGSGLDAALDQYGDAALSSTTL